MQRRERGKERKEGGEWLSSCFLLVGVRGGDGSGCRLLLVVGESRLWVLGASLPLLDSIDSFDSIANSDHRPSASRQRHFPTRHIVAFAPHHVWFVPPSVSVPPSLPPTSFFPGGGPVLSPLLLVSLVVLSARRTACSVSGCRLDRGARSGPATQSQLRSSVADRAGPLPGRVGLDHRGHGTAHSGVATNDMLRRPGVR